MISDNLIDHYKSLRRGVRTVFVVPLVNYSHPNTDYLYNLYRSFIESEEHTPGESSIQVKSLSVFAHFRFVWDQLLGRRILLHYHWLEFQDFKAAAGMVWKLACLWLYKQLGGKLIWTIHNRNPHRGRWPEANYRIRRWMGCSADKIHVHCSTVIPELSHYFGLPEQKFFVYPHPRFRIKELDKQEAIDKLNESYSLKFSDKENLFLMFGEIARYKGIEPVIKIFQKIPPHNHLLIAGRIKEGNRNYYQKLLQLSRKINQVHLKSRFIPDPHVPWIFNSTDYAVFNHRQIISSGSMELALEYGKPIIAPETGCIVERKDHSRIHLFNNKKELKQHLDDAVARLS